MTSGSIEPEVLFHIGFHKTGTTWLQRLVFVPHLDFQQVMSHRDVRRLITGPNRLDYDPKPVRVFLSGDQQPDQRAGARPVVSSELLCGNPFSGNREAADFAHRIQELGLPTRVLITVREQLSMIAATYSQYIRRGGTLTLDQFLDPAPFGFEGFDPNAFRYDRLVHLYQQLFGPSQVCVITHESIRANRLDELNRLRSFCNLEPMSHLPKSLDADVNKSTHESAIGINRRLNRLQRSAATPNPIVNLKWPAGALRKANEADKQRMSSAGRAVSRPVSAEITRRYSDHYRVSNRRLQALIGTQFDVTKLGYLV